MTTRAVLLIGAIALAVSGAAVHPFAPIQPSASSLPFEGAQIDSNSLAQLRQACGNCHSANIERPWYGYTAPMSWLIEKDVNEARAQFNFSRWADYPPEERMTLLSAIGSVLRTEAMPPKRYLYLHPHARLTSAERNSLYEWTRRERRRVRSELPK